MAHSKEDTGARVAFLENVLPQMEGVERCVVKKCSKCREKGPEKQPEAQSQTQPAQRIRDIVRAWTGRRISKWTSSHQKASSIW